MNKLTIIGNLTNEPDLRTTTSGKEVCTFTMAVNRPRKAGQDQGADFFKVTAWEEKGKLCKQFLNKGRKVCIIGPVSCRAYTNSKGEASASMEVRADEIEFVSPKAEGQTEARKDPASEVDHDPDPTLNDNYGFDDLPF